MLHVGEPRRSVARAVKLSTRSPTPYCFEPRWNTGLEPRAAVFRVELVCAPAGTHGTRRVTVRGKRGPSVQGVSWWRTDVERLPPGSGTAPGGGQRSSGPAGSPQPAERVPELERATKRPGSRWRSRSHADPLVLRSTESRSRLRSREPAAASSHRHGDGRDRRRGGRPWLRPPTRVVGGFGSTEDLRRRAAGRLQRPHLAADPHARDGRALGTVSPGHATSFGGA